MGVEAARGGAVKQLWVTSKSDAIRAGFNCMARSVALHLLPDFRTRHIESYSVVDKLSNPDRRNATH